MPGWTSAATSDRPQTATARPARRVVKTITLVKAGSVGGGAHAVRRCSSAASSATTSRPIPGDYLTDQTGTWMLACLMASLSVTPIRRLTGWNEIIKVRRLLGLFAFFYGVQHLLTWIVFVHYFDVGFMVEDVVKRPFITVGHGRLPDPARPHADVQPLRRPQAGAALAERCTGWCTWPASPACCTSGSW